MKNRVSFFLSVMILLIGGIGSTHAQRPVGDTIIGAEPTYMYGIYDWWRCANHDPEAPQWYTDTSDPLFTCMFGAAFDTLMRYYSGPRWDYIPSPTSPPGGIQEGSEPFQLFPGNNIRGVQMVTDRPIKIVGIAACAYAQAPRDTTLWYYRYELHIDNPTHLFPNTRDTTLAGRLTDSLILYKPTASGPSFLTGGPWRVEWPHRYLPLPQRWSYYDNVGDFRRDLLSSGVPSCMDSTPVVPLYEVMFDKPEVVTDSFIVAGTSNNNDGSYGTQYLPGNENFSEIMWLWDYRPTRYWTISYSNVWDWLPSYGGEDLGITYEQNVLWYKYRGASWMRFPQLRAVSDNNWWIQVIQTHAIFPIIDPDFDTTLCDEVSDVRQAAATDTTLTLMWDGGNNVEWEVEYFEMNTPTVIRVTTTVPMVTLTGLRERTNYMARVRGRCEWDTEFGEWSGYVDLWTGVHHDDPVSIEGNLGRFTQIMPNPAREQVTVLSSYRLSRVVVYDLGGRAVLEQEDEGLATTLDVSGLAKGVYVVAIHTPAGIATKRLVVEN